MKQLVHRILLLAAVQLLFVSADQHIKVQLDGCSESCEIKNKNDVCDWIFTFCGLNTKTATLRFQQGEAKECLEITPHDEFFSFLNVNTDECNDCFDQTFEICFKPGSHKMSVKLWISESNNSHAKMHFFPKDLIHPFSYSFPKFDFSCSLGAASVYNVGICPSNNTDLTCPPTSLQFHKEPKSWIEALKLCRQLNASLVQIINQTAQQEVVHLLKNKTGLEKGVWVGLERSIFGTNPEWTWTSGSKAESPDWNGSFPVDRWNNHCGKIIWINESEGIKLLDANCHEELPYICQAGPV